MQQEQITRSDEEALMAAVADRADAGWRWIGEHLDRFLPTDPFDPDARKPFSELALLYGYSASWSAERPPGPDDPVRSFLTGFIADPVIAQVARRRLVLFNPYFIPYLALRALGYRHEAYEDGLTAASAAGYPAALEATPFRVLEMQHMMWRAGLRARPPSWGGAYARTVLGKASNPVHLNNPAAYSITHTLFYLTDFCGPTTSIPPAEADRIAAVVECLFVHYWRKGDWDLLSELAMNLVSLDRHRTPLFRDGVAAIVAAWQAHRTGGLPGPYLDAERARSDPDHRFMQTYHTTLVGTLFADAYLHRAREEGRR